jgi:hypothetical protein
MQSTSQVIPNGMNIRKYSVNDCNTDIGGDVTLHKHVAKKSRVDESLLVHPNIQSTYIYI